MACCPFTEFVGVGTEEEQEVQEGTSLGADG